MTTELATLRETPGLTAFLDEVEVRLRASVDSRPGLVAEIGREALAADSVIGAEAIFAPYRDGEIPNDDAARRYVADVFDRDYRRVDGYSLKVKLKEARERAGTSEPR